MRLQVKNIMTSPVRTATTESNVEQLREAMAVEGIHSIPIVEMTKDSDMKIQGIVTATDLQSITDESTLTMDIMTKKVHVVSPEASVKSAANMMLRHKVHHLVAMYDGAIVGMLSALDFVKVVAEHDIK